MKFLRNNWVKVLLALISIIGIATGKFLFIFLAIPLGAGIFDKKNKNE
tara:strand:- start:2309 stop:2452 length:144 start_codon:yes stop_codon:yes gene_type:complete